MLRVLLCLFAGLFLAACSQPEEVVLRVGIPNKLGDRALLQAAGLDKDLPYRLEWSEFSATPALMEALRGESIDIGAGGTTGVIFEAANAGTRNFSVVAVTRSSAKGSQAILTGSGSTIKTVEDLKGKRVALLRGSLQQYQLALVLEKHGMSFKDIELSFVPNDVALAALINGTVDAWLTWDPQRAMAQRQHDAQLLAWLGDYYVSDYLHLVSNKSLHDSAKAKAVEDYFARLKQARAYANEHPQQLAEASARLAKIPVDIALELTTRNTGTVITPDQKARDGLQQEVGFWLGQQEIAKALDVSILFGESLKAQL